jgi:ankyrin repeat protein
MGLWKSKAVSPSDVNDRDSFGHTRLDRAIFERDVDAVERLLGTAGIDVSLPSRGLLPIARAVWESSLTITKRLIDFDDGKVNEVDSNGDTPLHIVVAMPVVEDREAKLRALLQVPGLDLHVQTRSGLTAFEIARQRGHMKLAQLIFEEVRVRACACVCVRVRSWSWLSLSLWLWLWSWLW